MIPKDYAPYFRKQITKRIRRKANIEAALGAFFTVLCIATFWLFVTLVI